MMGLASYPFLFCDSLIDMDDELNQKPDEYTKSTDGASAAEAQTLWSLFEGAYRELFILPMVEPPKGLEARPPIDMTTQFDPPQDRPIDLKFPPKIELTDRVSVSPLWTPKGVELTIKFD